MKKVLLQTFMLSTIYLAAQEVAMDDEYPYIKPIAVENAVVPSALEPKPLDDDGDGVLNADDKCPNTKAGENVDKLGCLLKLDADEDGVPDDIDACPETTIGTDVDIKGCEVDSDNDGVVDSIDQCADTTKEFVVDAYGCPQTATLKVTFEPNKYNISDELINQLEDFALFLNENQGYSVIIYGYTDSSGYPAKNKILSQNRANSVREALIEHGIEPDRLTAIGKGEADPIADNATPQGREENRRIEVELVQ